MNPSLKNRKGVALINALGTVSILLVLGAAFLTSVAAENLLINRAFLSACALSAAEAGADFAAWERKFGGNDFLPADGWAIADAGGIVRRSFSGSIQGNNGVIVGDYTVVVTDPFAVDCTLESTGNSPSDANPDATRIVRLELEGMTIFDNAVFGGNDVTLRGGSTTDSYDSEVAAYDPANPGNRGNVNSNGDITLVGAPTQINGDANPGPGDAVNNPGNVSGSVDPSVADISLPPIDMASAQAVNDNATVGMTDNGNPGIDGNGDIDLGGGDNLTLNTGTYYIDEFELKGNSTLTLAPGAVVDLYVVDDVALAGGAVINTDANPLSLTIYYNGNNAAQLTGGTAFYGGFYAPNAASVLIAGGADVYGSIAAGGTVNINGGSNIHYDEALSRNNNMIIPEATAVIAWQEK
ncbi:MAG: hypothetical protein ABIJ27_03190 [Candidatus Omnitrophota bacterium]